MLKHVFTSGRVLAATLLLGVISGCSKSPEPTAADPGSGPSTPVVSGVSELSDRIKVDWSEIDDPQTDGWDSEHLAEIALSQLDQLGLWMKDGSARDGELLAVGAVADSPLRPRELVVDSDDGVLRVEHGAAVERAADYDLVESINEALVGGVKSASVKFKIIGVEVRESGRDFTTSQHVAVSYQTGESRVDERSVWDVEWRFATGEEPGSPRIARLGVREFRRTTRRGAAPLFADCTEAVFGKDPCYAEQLSFGMNHWLERLPAYEMLNRFGTPGIALGDVDGDGLEDLYLCQEPGLPNRLFLQEDDGTLRDVSEEWGVDWLEDSRSALLVDLDNDGDLDLALAIFGNVVIARNVGSRFEIAMVLDASESTTSLAAADYDGDGLLDIYICGYARDRAQSAEEAGAMGVLTRRFVYHDDDNGAPNFLYRNRGGLGFEDVTAAVGLDANNERWSFAASWEDFDLDGDQDLYVANDYGRNNLYRNDGGRFVDVAGDLGVEDSASGMSAAWGDFDLDGRPDLYVSNMFSAAGSRVTRQAKFKADASSEVRGRFRRFTRGNSLFRNLGDRFEDVSEAAGVTLGRWAWGSNFVDLDNDGWLDLLVANGYLSSDEDGGGDL